VTKSPATCWNAGRFIGVVVKGLTHGSDGRRDNTAEGRANESQPSRCGIFPTGRVVPVLWEAGGRVGSKWSSARPGAQKGGAVQEIEEGRDKREGESCWKGGGGPVRLYILAKSRAGR
jgi:hypothetical protein